ncbi:MAG TPA: lytic transglycosylase domain-containing protein [Patescibacteria group bacterium]|nr:lytic transglycosylase domain-containing protein [Patescibacteria group bacterium]
MTLGQGPEAINQIMGRIRSIEQRFGNTDYRLPDEKFDSVLASKTSTSAGGTTVAGRTERTTVSADETGIAGMVYRTAEKYGVDPKLALAVAKTESGLQKDVVSSAGAVGVMQLMPDTARSLGVKNINDPQENIEGGVKYIKQMLGRFQGDVPKALAAYNAGPAAVESYQGIPPYQETQEYVNKILSLVR